LPDVEEHDYPAAASYLSLLYKEAEVQKMILRFRVAELTQFKAKDIFRASGLPLLGMSNFHTEKNKEKIRQGKRLSPLLLIRESQQGKVVIADGYHRLCAIYEFNEDAFIACKII
jgi:disulfide oxidoreductase YuzD